MAGTFHLARGCAITGLPKSPVGASVPIYDIRCLRPWQKTGLAAILRLSSSRKEACYARNKITHHHFTLGGGWRRVCGIRNDRRTRRRRPGLQAQSSRNRRSMHRSSECEQPPCASTWHSRQDSMHSAQLRLLSRGRLTLTVWAATLGIGGAATG